MTTSITRSSHVISLWDGEIVEESELGSMRRVTADNFPILKGLSIKRVLLNPAAMRTPHWHANANELTYCVSGTALVSVLDDGSRFSSFIVTIHRATRTLPPKPPADHGLAARIGDPDIPASAYFNDPHKFDIEAQTPPLNYATGQARFARDQYWPALKDMSMYSLRVAQDGMREPHWHPVTAEMGYVQHGTARMTVMNPDGTLDTWPLNAGDAYFIPRAYPHHIENTGSDGWHFLIFFDQPFPADIGYRASASAYSREVLAAAFNTPLDDLPHFPFTPADPLIVTRTNPVDPR